ncbi:alpha-amylase A-like isoform X4 [Cherax quadricarinatus]|uniref:alpha-amylase A-like isoform X3 n=1 Tax=Cherax quadricarinatus TaxID=27406 RepID=UPI00387E8777
MFTLWLVVVVVVVVSGARGYDTPSCDGRQTIVELFEWKWTDVAEECERFLGDAGYCAVQVSPAAEHTVIAENGYPWWQRYQPVSYTLESRSGTAMEFIDMVQRCNAVGVRVIVDVVVNHMAELGRSGYGSGGTTFNADQLDFPGVPYTSVDFTPQDLCPSADGIVGNNSDVYEVRNCYLLGLTDLYTSSYHVREQLAHYLNLLLDIGVMGFRVEAAKYVWPEDLEAILSLTNNLNTAEGFPSATRPFIYHQINDQGGEPISVNDYFGIGLTTEYRYSEKIAAGVDDFALLNYVYDSEEGMAPPYKALVFVDDHDNQRGYGSTGDVLTYKQIREYQMGVSFSLAYDYGVVRLMSSYDFDDNDQGPPDSSSSGATDTVPINADGSCGGGWICEHRWNSIVQMVMFRNVVAGTQVELWYQEDDNVAFSRGHLGFFAMSKSGSLDTVLQTGLPAGLYCELISSCTRNVTVDTDGTARITINDYQLPFIAFCVGCGTVTTPSPDQTTTVIPTTPMTTLPTTMTTTTIPTTTTPLTTESTTPPFGGKVKTVIFLYKQTNPGQDIFIIGGIDIAHRPGCTSDAESDVCALDITVNSLGTNVHYDRYNAWRAGDTKLDWYGAQAGQGTYNGQVASGTPLVWTTSNSGAPEYQELNTYGDSYWMVDMIMDCAQTDEGWFHFKAYLTNAGSGWEDDINQVSPCSGDVGGSEPYATVYHTARCGYLNVFEFSGSSCMVSDLP